MKKIKYRTYKTFKEIVYKFYGGKSCYVMIGNKKKLFTQEEFLETVGNNVWGFCNKKDNIIHLWHNGKDDKELLRCIAHEFAHLLNKKRMTFLEEERFADRIAETVIQIADMYNKIKKNM